MRIVAGSLRSRRLAAPGGRTRPSSDRLRESLFAALGDIEGSACLDLFAGSGALGLEALSRGAAHCVFCEVDPAALTALRTNVAALAVEDRCEVRARDARRSLRTDVAGSRRYDLLLIDPPYRALPDFQPVLDRYLGRVARDGARLVVESPADLAPAYAGFEVVSRRRVGAAAVAILRVGTEPS